MSKRTSKLVKTTLLGGAGLSAMFVLTGCNEDEVTTHAYTSVAECVAADVYDDQFCETNWEKALADHAAKAPRYESITDCEKDFGAGQCSRPDTVIVQNGNDGGSGFFFPYMMGYMMAGGGSTNNYYSTPLYNNTSGGYRSLSGSSVSRTAFSRAGSTVRPSTMKAPTKAPTFTRGVSVSSRGGFGSTGRGLTAGS